jgi:hypothetical protein
MFDTEHGHLVVRRPRRIDEPGNVGGDQAVANGLLDGAMDDPMDVQNGGGAEAASQPLVVQAIEVLGG